MLWWHNKFGVHLSAFSLQFILHVINYHKKLHFAKDCQLFLWLNVISSYISFQENRNYIAIVPLTQILCQQYWARKGHILCTWVQCVMARAVIFIFRSAQKLKISWGHWLLISCQVSSNPVPQTQRNSSKCLSQSEVRAANLFFRSAPHERDRGRWVLASCKVSTNSVQWL